MRDALSLTDQAIAYGNQTVNEAEVRSMLGAIDQSYLFELLHALQANNGAGIVEIAKQMQARSIAFEAALNDLAILLHQIAMAQTVPDSIADDLPERTVLLDLAQKLSPETLQLYYQIVLLGRRDIGLAPDEYAGFTMTLLRMLAFMPTEKSTFAPTEKLEHKATQAATPRVAEKPEIALAASIPAKTVIADTISDTGPEAAPVLVPTSSAIFDGNWRGLIEQNLKLGLARALAQNCEMITFDENSISLRVAESNKHLASASYQDKLSSAINDYFGKKIKLNVEIGAANQAEINTPAKQNATEKANIQSSATDAIMQDSFVQALMNDLGATIIKDSIKPI